MTVHGAMAVLVHNEKGPGTPSCEPVDLVRGPNKYRFPQPLLQHS